MDENEETKQPDNIIYNKNDSSVSSFISHLITAFKCRGIKLFSGICLVIFSRDYASSVSCLENLAKHLELSCCDKKSYKVVPVFYGVSRSDVRQQSGPFSDAFTELERSYPADKVTRLRWALAKIAELKGHEYDEEFSKMCDFFITKWSDKVDAITYNNEPIVAVLRNWRITEYHGKNVLLSEFGCSRLYLNPTFYDLDIPGYIRSFTDDNEDDLMMELVEEIREQLNGGAFPWMF